MIVLLDLDGTISDPYVGIRNAWRFVSERLGLAVLDEEQQRAAIGPPLEDTLLSLGLDDHAVQQGVHAYRSYYDTTGLFENTVYPGMPEVLEELGGTATLALATSKPADTAARILDRFGLVHHFAVVGGATRDGSVRRKADVVARTLAELGSPDPADVTMVGDRLHDVHGAGQHGVRCLGVRWGYGAPGELEAAGAYAVAEAPADIPRLLPSPGSA
ncbi:phosphoglycolate phosphatase [Motilibacter rhizosphaerae]|uniref:Phosphoglycolate phosphatase n=1 Tax=Motilibacter rhizosphaerae TaxID=598652 RepID=A0A4Q7NQG5_9ACTN|nr:HAD hydrolase-like protein [Motilibacter rhizosphaerae]RZS87539.1 phosphoglycolate phosphatase [Motilibacter rhizosphaerae]